MTESFLLILGVVFAISSMAKLRDVPAFDAVMRGLVGLKFARPAAYSIIALEFALAAALLSGYEPRAAAIVTLVVLAGFTRVLLHMRKKQMKGCGCFGESANEDTIAAGVFRNLLLMLLGCIVVVDPRVGSPWAGGVSIVVARLTIALAAACTWPLLVAAVERRALLPLRKYFVTGPSPE